MSIEKLNTKSNSHLESLPFVQILNFVTENIKDNDAFRIWVFCLSKSMEWTVIKDWTQTKCGVGKTKGKQVWSYLQRCNLIDTIPIKDAQGKIIKWDLKVLNGMNFDSNEPFKSTRGMKTIPVDKSTKKDTKNHRYGKPPGGKTTRVEKRPLLNKDIYQQEKKTKETKKRERENINPPSQDLYLTEENQKLCETKSIGINIELEKYICFSVDKQRSYSGAGFRKWLLDARINKTSLISNSSFDNYESLPKNEDEVLLRNRFFNVPEVHYRLEEMAKEICLKDPNADFKNEIKLLITKYGIR